MAVYDLYVESGPRRRRTMVHVPQMLGCVATGPTTEAAMDATPEAIRAFRRFLVRSGEPIDDDDVVDLRVVEHVTEGAMLGDGSPYIRFAADMGAISAPEIDIAAARLTAMFSELADWAGTQPDERLDAPPPSGRSAREILLHVMGAQGPALSIALGTARGFGAIHGAARRGERPLPVALLEVASLAAAQLRGTDEGQRRHVRELASGTYTLRTSTRHMLEHAWNHLVELSRRRGGPTL